jgi:hypothetical protein
MKARVRDCIVSEHEIVISGLSLPDPKDHHLLAAIRASASLIVTYNLKDFPAKAIEPYNIDVWYPDDFISYWIDTAPGIVCAAIQRPKKSLTSLPDQ